MFSYQVDDELEIALPQPHQVEEMTAVVRENLEHLKPWMPWATEDYSVESAKDFVQRTLTEFALDGRFNANILLNEKIVGNIGFHNLDVVNKSAEIGYWVSKDAQGRGIITKCCRVIIDYLFDVTGLNRVQINCNVENTRSRAVPERLGFKLEGVHRQCEYMNGKFGDWAIYAMLRSEWTNSGQ